MSDDRVLGYSVPVHVPDKPSVTYPAGTSASSIPEEHLALMTNPRLWERSPAAVDEPVDEPGPVFVENPSAPNSLDECSVEELREIADREEIPLGRLKDPEKIREVITQALGIGAEGDNA